MGTRMNIPQLLMATACLAFISGYTDLANAENFFKKLQHQADKLQEKLGNTSQGPVPELLGTWESQVPNNHWQMNIVWNDKEKRYEGRLVKQGALSQKVGFVMGELIWKAVSSDNKITEEQEYRSGPKNSFWRKGTVSKVSTDELVSSAAATRFIRVKQSAVSTPSAAPANSVGAAEKGTVVTGGPVNSNVSADSGAEIASSKSIEVDVVGLRLGMSTSEVEKIFKQRKLDNGIVPPRVANGDGRRDGILSYKDISTGRYIEIKGSEYINEFRGSKGQPYIDENVSTRFTPLHKKEQLVYILRHQNFEVNPNQQPQLDSLIKTLQDKYGPNMMKVGSYNNYVWAYNNEGKPLKNLEPQCLEFANYDSNTAYWHGFINSGDFYELEKKIKKCGTIIVQARILARDGFVKDLTVIAKNMSLDLHGSKTARSIMLAAEKSNTDRELAKSRAQKPEL